MIRVLVVDDSATAREYLAYLIGADPEVQVIGTARDGQEAIGAVRDLHPDVVVMDLMMPVMDGIEATRVIMETNPTPIVIVSAVWLRGEVEMTFRALGAGALAALEKPVGLNHPQHERLARELARTVRLMAGVKVVGRRNGLAPTVVPSGPGPTAPAQPCRVRFVAIGASTGGPSAIATVLRGLPAGFPAPVLVVQHIARGFIAGFASWLAESCRLPVAVAEQGQVPQAGHVYVAPDNRQMGVASDGTLALRDDAPEGGLRPSVSYLFRSLIPFARRGLVAVLLTGMGRDGASELKQLRDLGAVTIAQDRESCIVFGMPGEAVALGAATAVLSPSQVASYLAGLCPGNTAVIPLAGRQ